MKAEEILPLGSSVFAFESTGIAKGYSATNSILKSFESSLIEATPMLPGRLMVLINMKEEDLERAREVTQSLLKRDVFRIAKFNEMNPSVLHSLYGLKKSELKDCLVVAESDSTVDLLKVANDILLENGIDVFDIRSNRGLGSTALLYATISDEKRLLAESLLEGLELLETFSIISELHPQVRGLFEV